MPIQITYFPVKARVLPVLVARVGGLDFVFTPAENWPGELKAKCPFGQVPLLQDGSLTLGQSLAIANYLAKKANLLGSTDEEFGLSQSLLQEAEDIYSETYSSMSNPHVPEKKPGYDAFVEKLPLHLANLEKLVNGDKFTANLTVGELAVFLDLYLLLEVFPAMFEKLPKLQAFYKRMLALPKVSEFLEKDASNFMQCFQHPK